MNDSPPLVAGNASLGESLLMLRENIQSLQCLDDDSGYRIDRSQLEMPNLLSELSRREREKKKMINSMSSLTNNLFAVECQKLEFLEALNSLRDDFESRIMELKNIDIKPVSSLADEVSVDTAADYREGAYATEEKTNEIESTNKLEDKIFDEKQNCEIKALPSDGVNDLEVIGNKMNEAIELKISQLLREVDAKRRPDRNSDGRNDDDESSTASVSSSVTANSRSLVIGLRRAFSNIELDLNLNTEPRRDRAVIGESPESVTGRGSRSYRKNLFGRREKEGVGISNTPDPPEIIITPTTPRNPETRKKVKWKGGDLKYDCISDMDDNEEEFKLVKKSPRRHKTRKRFGRGKNSHTKMRMRLFEKSTNDVGILKSQSYVE